MAGQRVGQRLGGQAGHIVPIGGNAAEGLGGPVGLLAPVEHHQIHRPRQLAQRPDGKEIHRRSKELWRQQPHLTAGPHRGRANGDGIGLQRSLNAGLRRRVQRQALGPKVEKRLVDTLGRYVGLPVVQQGHQRGNFGIPTMLGRAQQRAYQGAGLHRIAHHMERESGQFVPDVSIVGPLGVQTTQQRQGQGLVVAQHQSLGPHQCRLPQRGLQLHRTSALFHCWLHLPQRQMAQRQIVRDHRMVGLLCLYGLVQAASVGPLTGLAQRISLRQFRNRGICQSGRLSGGRSMGHDGRTKLVRVRSWRRQGPPRAKTIVPAPAATPRPAV